MKLMSILICTIVIICGAVGVIMTRAQERTVSYWTWEKCYTNSCIKNKLDSLPLDRAHEAKLTTWENVTYVWYRP